VMNTGPLFVARFASLVPWLNSRLEIVVMAMVAPRRTEPVAMLLHLQCYGKHPVLARFAGGLRDFCI
jgi:hypothetical protein